MIRECSNCKSKYPLTEEYFYKMNECTRKEGYRFSYRCIDCQRQYNMQKKREQRKRDEESNIKRAFK